MFLYVFCCIYFLLTLDNQNIYSVGDKICNRCFYSFQYLAIYNYNYRGKYLLRRIPHALDGSFNPYVISNIEAYIINGNMFMGKVTKCNATTISEQSQQRKMIEYIS